MDNKELLLRSYLLEIEKHWNATVSLDIKKANKIFDNIFFKIESKLDIETLEHCLKNKTLSEWQEFWILRKLYIETKNKKYWTMLESLYLKTKDNLVKVEVSSFVDLR